MQQLVRYSAERCQVALTWRESLITAERIETFQLICRGDVSVQELFIASQTLALVCKWNRCRDRQPWSSHFDEQAGKETDTMHLCVDAVCLDFNLGVRPAATLVIALKFTSPGRSTVMQSARRALGTSNDWA